MSIFLTYCHPDINLLFQNLRDVYSHGQKEYSVELEFWCKHLISSTNVGCGKAIRCSAAFVYNLGFNKVEWKL